jgi:hypothetical protein
LTAREADFEPNRQDNDIFQLSRNINVGFFATVVLKDYVAAILNTPRADSEWWLNLGAEIKSGGQRLERGTGSVVSTEFAVLYHWHAALSAADDQWMEEIIRQAIPELKDIDDMTPEMMTRVYMVSIQLTLTTYAPDTNHCCRCSVTTSQRPQPRSGSSEVSREERMEASVTTIWLKSSRTVLKSLLTLSVPMAHLLACDVLTSWACCRRVTSSTSAP